MALIAGAGNPTASGGTTGTGKTLNYVGEFAFAYSGGVDADNNETTLLEFSTGSELFVGIWQGYYYASVYGEDFRWTVYLNDEKVQSYTAEGSIRGNSRSQLHIIIPGYTQVKITGSNVTDTTTREIMASVTGRIY